METGGIALRATAVGLVMEKTPFPRVSSVAVVLRFALLNTTATLMDSFGSSSKGKEEEDLEGGRAEPSRRDQGELFREIKAA